MARGPEAGHEVTLARDPQTAVFEPFGLLLAACENPDLTDRAEVGGEQAADRSGADQANSIERLRVLDDWSDTPSVISNLKQPSSGSRRG
jgi:hypothetical protein